jgi:hypothetical protein
MLFHPRQGTGFLQENDKFFPAAVITAPATFVKFVNNGDLALFIVQLEDIKRRIWLPSKDGLSSPLRLVVTVANGKLRIRGVLRDDGRFSKCVAEEDEQGKSPYDYE